MEEPKHRPRRPRKQQESLLVPRLLWFSVYLSLCFVAFKGMKYFSELLPNPNISLAHQHPSHGVPLQGLNVSFLVADRVILLQYATYCPAQCGSVCCSQQSRWFPALKSTIIQCLSCMPNLVRITQARVLPRPLQLCR